MMTKWNQPGVECSRLVGKRKGRGHRVASGQRQIAVITVDNIASFPGHSLSWLPRMDRYLRAGKPLMVEAREGTSMPERKPSRWGGGMEVQGCDGYTGRACR